MNIKKIGLLLSLGLAPYWIFAQSDTSSTLLDSTTQQEIVLDEAVVSSTKDPVIRTADRTIFDFSDQANLNSGTLLEGLKKLPGLLISDLTGLVYQGKQLEVYMDGRPLNIYSDELNSYLSGMPANAIERIEIITQPGAEFPATSGGAIINIISSRYYQRYLSATYSSGYRFSVYEKLRNRFNNSLMLQSGNKVFSWQLRIGQSYTERFQDDEYEHATFNLISDNFSDNTRRYYFLESGIKFNIGKDRLLFNYNLGTHVNTSDIDANVAGFMELDQSLSERYRHDLVMDYQKRFKDIHRKLDFKLNYIITNNDFYQKDRNTQVKSLDNNYDRRFLQFKTDYTQHIPLLDESKILVGVLAEKVDFIAHSFEAENLDYDQTTLSAYTEAQSKYQNFEFILGGRLESYDLSGATDVTNLTPFQQTRFFPNATAQYNIAPKIFLNANFNQKISLPSTSDLNPNNNTYQNQSVNFTGNPNLRPTIFNNTSLTFSAFEYFTISYAYTSAEDEIAFRILEDNNSLVRTYTNISQCRIQNFSIALPFPYMVFTQGLKKTLEFNFNPDEINFLYAYLGYNKQDIPDIETKGVWFVYLMSQIILPRKINFTTTYNTSTTGGNYYYIRGVKPFENSLDVNFSKKFDHDRLSISLFASDILNQNQRAYAAEGTDLILYRTFDSRRFGISLNYKIPTKRKSNKPTENLLFDAKSDDKESNF